MDDATMGLRERKKLETRRTIHRVALDLALKYGVEHLTVEAIAEAANISPRTFFNYFANKMDALVIDATGMAATLRSLITARPTDESPLHAIREALTQDGPVSYVNADRSRSLAQQHLAQQYPEILARQLGRYAVLERAFAEASAERLGVNPDDLRPALIAAVAVSALRVSLRRWTEDGSVDLTLLITASFDALEQGLLNEGGSSRA